MPEHVRRLDFTGPTSSYVREAPDVVSSSVDYASRFAGEAGAYLLDVQEAAVRSMLAPVPATGTLTVLDVGGGHGQLATPLAECGYRVTVFGSAPECRTRIGTGPSNNPVDFVAGDLLSLPFADRSFDTLLSVRIIAHLENWEQFIAEMCRVASSSVIIDYPAMASINVLSLLTFPLKKAIEGNTRAYRSFWNGELRAAFARHGFVPVRSHRQFCIPMAAHRLLGRTRLLRDAEGVLRCLGLTGLLGNPIVARFDRSGTAAG